MCGLDTLDSLCENNKVSVKWGQLQLQTVELASWLDKRCSYSALLRKRKALPMTDAELKLMANAAIMGDSSQPVNG